MALIVFQCQWLRWEMDNGIQLLWISIGPRISRRILFQLCNAEWTLTIGSLNIEATAWIRFSFWHLDRFCISDKTTYYPRSFVLLPGISWDIPERFLNYTCAQQRDWMLSLHMLLTGHPSVQLSYFYLNILLIRKNAMSIFTNDYLLDNRWWSLTHNLIY